MLALGLILAVFLGLIPAAIASNKGHNGFLWWLFGALLFIVALPLALILPRDTRELEARELRGGARRCPHCAELIRREAKVCRFCGRDVDPAPPSTSSITPSAVASPATPVAPLAPAAVAAPAEAALSPMIPPRAQARHDDGPVILAAVVVLAALVGVAAWIYRPGQPPPVAAETWDDLSPTRASILREVCAKGLVRAKASGVAQDFVLADRYHVEPGPGPARYRCGLAEEAGEPAGYLRVESADCAHEATCGVPVAFVRGGVATPISWTPSPPRRRHRR